MSLDDGTTQIVVAVQNPSRLFQPWNGPDTGDLYEWELDVPADSDPQIDLAPVQARFEEASHTKALTERSAAIVERNAMVAAPERVPTVIGLRPVTPPRWRA